MARRTQRFHRSRCPARRGTAYRISLADAAVTDVLTNLRRTAFPTLR
jgi:hypothetical protein